MSVDRYWKYQIPSNPNLGQLWRWVREADYDAKCHELAEARKELAEAREVLKNIANRGVPVQREEHRMAREWLERKP